MTKILKIGFGLTVLSNGLKRNHIDGIGVYSQELYQQLFKEKDLNLLPYVFGKEQNQKYPNIQSIHSKYIKHVFESQLLNKKIKIERADFLPDIIHATDHYIPEVKNVPVVATVMDLIPFIHPEWTLTSMRSLKNYLFKQKILSADHIITISDYSKSDLVNLFKIPEEKISVTSLGMNDNFYQQVSEEEKQNVLVRYALEKDFFLFVGTLQPRKNLEKALEAHSRLSAELRKRHPFVVVGNPGWANETLFAKMAEDEKKGYVRWLKYLNFDEVKALLQSALALVYVSLYEGFGLPIVEAFASQCPVITSNVTSIPEVAGDAAIQVSPLDIEEILDAMKQLIDSSGLRNMLIQKGLARANQFSWQNCPKDTFAAYQKLL